MMIWPPAERREGTGHEVEAERRAFGAVEVLLGLLEGLGRVRRR